MAVEQISQGLAASSIALYGATDREGHPGARPLAHLRRANYAGDVFPINPGRSEVAGHPAFPSLVAAGVSPDLALIAVPGDQVEAALQDAVDAGTKLVSIVTGGFGEVGEEGIARQERLRSIIRGTDTRVFGPNCLGLMAPAAGVFATGTAVVEAAWPTPGRVAVASQSGAVGCTILAELHRVGIGLRSWISTGNEMDLTIADVVAVAAEDPEVDSILIYVESIRNPEAMAHACSSATTAGKRVYALKAGRGQLGAKAVASHTGALATSDRFYSVLFEDAGVQRVDSIRELVGAVRLSPSFTAPATGGVAIFTLSGGLGALAADALEEVGLPAASIRDATQQRMKELVPGCAPSNPIDATGQASTDLDLLGSFLELVMTEPDVGVLVLILGHLGFTPSYTRRIIPLLSEMTARHDVPVISVTRVPEADQGTLSGTSIPVFSEVVDAVRAIKLVAKFDRAEHHSDVPFASAPNVGRIWPDHEGLAALQDAGIPTVPHIVLDDVAHLEKATASTGFPMVLKAVVPGVSHKTEIGAVRLDLQDPGAAEAAFRQLAELFGDGRPTVMAQPMLKGVALELIVGSIVDPVFGPHLLVGSGGIWAEVVNDTQIAKAPVDAHRAEAMLSALRVAPILKGARTGREMPLDGLVNVLVAVSTFAFERRERIQEIEINPFVVLDDGSVAAVDALIVERGDTGD